MTRRAGKSRETGAAGLIRLYKLKPHPEGGFFRETYRAAATAATPHGRRSWSTAVLFLLAEGDVSRLHRLKSDEVWHFYSGGPLRVSSIGPDGTVKSALLGPGGKFQHVVTAGSWFGAAAEPGAGWSLVGCTVAPGFDFRDFKLGSRKELLKRFPGAAKIIRRLTRQG